MRVASPVRGDTELLLDAVNTLQPAVPVVPSVMTPDALLKNILAPVKEDVVTMNENLKNVVGNRHPMLLAAAEQIFGAGGKKLRPVIVFLVARATADMMGLRYSSLNVQFCKWQALNHSLLPTVISQNDTGVWLKSLR